MEAVFLHSEAVILHFLAAVWVITWGTTAMAQGFAGRGELSGLHGAPGAISHAVDPTAAFARVSGCCSRKGQGSCAPALVLISPHGEQSGELSQVTVVSMTN